MNMKSLMQDFINLSEDVDLNCGTCFMSRGQGGWMNHKISAENLFVILKGILPIDKFLQVLSDDFKTVCNIHPDGNYWIKVVGGGNRFIADPLFSPPIKHYIQCNTFDVKKVATAYKVVCLTLCKYVGTK